MDPVTIRHILHAMPELADQEEKTQAWLRDLLTSWELDVRSCARTGLLVVWDKGDVNAPYRLFRADMDGLPLMEETGVDFASRNHGCMHACGHDVHMAILVGLIDRVRQANIEANLLFLFQPAEEGGGGAERALTDLRAFPIVEAWALHVTDEYPLGTIACRPGLLFASAFEMDVRFRGRSAHVAFYRQGRDALEGGVAFFQTAYSRDWGRAVVRFGQMAAGRVRNAVPADCMLRGTLRTESIERSTAIAEELGAMGRIVADARELTCETHVGSKYPQVMVHLDLYNKLVATMPVTECDMKFVGEDFGFFSLEFPSALFWLGTRAPGAEAVGLHHQAFLPPDEAIAFGIEAFWRLLDIAND